MHHAHAPARALERVVALRVHLDDSTADNGPLRVLPGTHVGGVLTDVQVGRLAATLAPVVCLAARGGMTNAGRLKDLADVQELIRAGELPLELRDDLHPCVREKYGELWQATRPE